MNANPYENAAFTTEQLRGEYSRYIFLAKQEGLSGNYYGRKHFLWCAKCVREEIERRGETVR